MKIDLHKIHEAYLARESALVQVDSALKERLRQQLFPRRTLAWFVPAFATLAMIAIVVITQPKADQTALFEPSAAGSDIADFTTTDTTDEFNLYSIVNDEPVLFDDDQVVPGIRGSYCDESLCVDTAAPWETEDVRFIGISAPLVLKLPRPAENVQFGLRDETGMRLLCAVQTNELDDTTYEITGCGDSGERHYLDISIWWLAGGDVSYSYPIIVE